MLGDDGGKAGLRRRLRCGGTRESFVPARKLPANPPRQTGVEPSNLIRGKRLTTSTSHAPFQAPTSHSHPRPPWTGRNLSGARNICAAPASPTPLPLLIAELSSPACSEIRARTPTSTRLAGLALRCDISGMISPPLLCCHTCVSVWSPRILFAHPTSFLPRPPQPSHFPLSCSLSSHTAHRPLQIRLPPRYSSLVWILDIPASLSISSKRREARKTLVCSFSRYRLHFPSKADVARSSPIGQQLTGYAGLLPFGVSHGIIVPAVNVGL